MSSAQSNEPAPRKPLRLWPGVVIAALLLLFKLAVVPFVGPGGPPLGLIGGLVGGLAVVVWWVFFSRAPWSERLGAVALMIVALFATKPFLHPSVAGAGMGVLFFVMAIPVMGLALVAWAAASRRLSDGPRRAAMLVTILLACGVFTLLRTGGITGEGHSDLRWRWSKTPEERLLAQSGDAPLDSARGGAAAQSSAPTTAETPDKRLPPQASDESSAPTSVPAAAKTHETRVPTAVGDEPTTRLADPAGARADADWPGFRGPARDGIVRGVRIETDWSRTPPVELWRRPIGPGWSSFAVRGDLVYTQEQRGEDEIVSCYRLSTGEPVWMHRDATRFWESNGGPGPRATPALSDGRVYTLGATGILNALDAATGAVVWSRNAATDTGKTIPDWGLASSPLVIDDLVIAAVAGQLIAYDVATGNPRWVGQPGGGGYSSPHFATIDGVAQVLLQRGARTISIAPADGTLLWDYSWQPSASIVQPALTADGDVLITTADAMGGQGMRRLAVAHESSRHDSGQPGGWTVEERWTSRGLKPYFNDYVVHEGHAFGFDGSILASVDLADGERKWKGGRYGHGQLVLLADQDVLLVLSEDGELALVGATPDQFRELARFPALDGKTWNHPVLVGDVLLIRNGEEMAAFRLPLAPQKNTVAPQKDTVEPQKNTEEHGTKQKSRE